MAGGRRKWWVASRGRARDRDHATDEVHTPLRSTASPPPRVSRHCLTCGAPVARRAGPRRPATTAAGSARASIVVGWWNEREKGCLCFLRCLGATETLARGRVRALEGDLTRRGERAGRGKGEMKNTRLSFAAAVSHRLFAGDVPSQLSAEIKKELSPLALPSLSPRLSLSLPRPPRPRNNDKSSSAPLLLTSNALRIRRPRDERERRARARTPLSSQTTTKGSRARALSLSPQHRTLNPPVEASRARDHHHHHTPP